MKRSSLGVVPTHLDATPECFGESGEAEVDVPGNRRLRAFGGIPGEHARFRVLGAGHHEVAAVFEHAERPTGARRQFPPCPIWLQCRSCDWIHLDPLAQAAEKRRAVVRALSSLLEDAERRVAPVCIGDLDLGYRSRAIFAWDPLTRQLGGYVRSSHDLVDTIGCSVHHPDQGRVARHVRDVAATTPLGRSLRFLVVRRSRTGALQVTFTMRRGTIASAMEAARHLAETLGQAPSGIFACEIDDASHRVLSSPHRHLHGEPVLEEQLGELRFSLGPEDFFQINVPLAEHLARHLVDLLDPRDGELALDLYCGVGPHALGLASRGAHVLGVERSERAIAAARRNADRNGLADRATFLAAPVGETSAAMLCERLGGPARSVVVNPPRRGLESGAIALLAKLSPERIAYVSCSPAALGRDFAALQPHGFEIEGAWPYDLFPQTRHVETLVLARRER